MKTRAEEDSLGLVHVPESAYYGAQTRRAADNFPISGLMIPTRLIRALALIKKHAAEVNLELGLLEEKLAQTIVQAAREVMNGRLEDQFVVDIFQTGSGTSTNMNVNEVIAGRANEIITGKKGGKIPVHPNDHVNLGQSSNDVFPSAIHLAALIGIKEHLIPAMETLQKALEAKAEEFKEVQKIGRTHLQDAVTLTLGQEFSGYARQIEMGIRRIYQTGKSLSELALGGTAVGTGLNTHPEFAKSVIDRISVETGIPFREAVNHFEAQAAQDAAVETSGALKTVAVSLTKIANDLRWLASGPKCGLGEIGLPSLQPGSSIMPGKVNPVIPEAVIQVAAQVVGCDAVITIGGQWGFFELNTMLPVIAYNLLLSIEILGSAALIFAEKCVSGITVRDGGCSAGKDQSVADVTRLASIIGYDRAAKIAKEAQSSGKSVREVVIEQNILSEEEIDKLLK